MSVMPPLSTVPDHERRLTLVLVIRKSRGVKIIATSEVEKSISMIETSPDAPLSDSGDWKTSAKGSVEYIRKPSVVATNCKYCNDRREPGQCN